MLLQRPHRDEAVTRPVVERAGVADGRLDARAARLPRRGVHAAAFV